MTRLEKTIVGSYPTDKVERCVEKHSKELKISFKSMENGSSLLHIAGVAVTPRLYITKTVDDNFTKVSVDIFLQQLNRIIKGNEKEVNYLRDCIQG